MSQTQETLSAPPFQVVWKVARGRCEDIVSLLSRRVDQSLASPKFFKQSLASLELRLDSPVSEFRTFATLPLQTSGALTSIVPNSWSVDA